MRPMLLVAALGVAGPLHGQGAYPAVEAFAARLAADVAADSVGALAAAVIVGDSVVWQGAFGVADRETGAPATPATVFRAGSITKVATAAALMRLATRSVVALDEPVVPWVPELVGLAGLQTTSRPITFRDLASHTAGLEREPSSSRAARGRWSAWTTRVREAIPLTEVRTAPGAAYRYSNIGYGILGLALERRSGRPFAELVAAEVLAPLEMRNTWFAVPRRARQRLATGYVNLSDGTIDPRVPRAEQGGRGYRVPGEGLYTTVGDLARLIMGLTGAEPGFLDEGTRREMRSDHDPAGDDRVGYGLGLQLTRIGGTLLAGHSGTAAGYASYLVFDPERRIGVVLLRSYNMGGTNLGAEAQRVVLELGSEVRR